MLEILSSLNMWFLVYLQTVTNAILYLSRISWNILTSETQMPTLSNIVVLGSSKKRFHK